MHVLELLAHHLHALDQLRVAVLVPELIASVQPPLVLEVSQLAQEQALAAPRQQLDDLPACVSTSSWIIIASCGVGEPTPIGSAC